MPLMISGSVTSRQTARGTAGLWVEIRHEDRLVARAAEPTDEGGRFRLVADERALRELLGDTRAALTLLIRRDDGSEIALVSAPAVAWPPERDKIRVKIEVDLPAEGRQPARIEDLSAVLDRPVPDALLDRLRDHGIRTLADVRAAGGLARIEGLTGAQERAARTLEAHARLEVVSVDAAVNARLVGSGVFSVTALARADAAALAGKTGLELATVRDLKDRAGVLRWVIDHDLSGALISHAPANSFYTFNSVLLERKKHWAFDLFPRAPNPDTCQSCATCASALGPAAYLVDLIDFLIDNFKQQVVQTSSTVKPRGFPNLKAIEDRFYRPFGALVVDCETADQPIRQIEITIEVLEQFVMKVANKSREDIYAVFPYQPSVKPRFPKPDALSQMFDAYLTELGLSRAKFDAAITGAYPASSSAQPDKTKLNELLAPLGVTEGALKKGLDLTDASWEPHIKALDWLPELVRTAKTTGLDPNDVTQLAAHSDAIARAAAAVGRVKDSALPDIRANLISYAIYPLTTNIPRNPAITTARQLGNFLHIDLEVGPCARTTRLASAIDALQSWVDAFRTGREDPGYYLMFGGGLSEGNFDARWRWLRSYSTWQAAQSVLLYPENFLMTSVRRDKSAEFVALLDNLDEAGSDDELIWKAVDTYLTAIRQRGGSFTDANRFRTHPTSHFGVGLETFHKFQQTEYLNLTPDMPLWWALDEWYFYLPLAVAEHLNVGRAHERAATWLHNVLYPFAGNYPSDFPFPPVRLVWAGFNRVREPGFTYRNTIEWLSDPFDPFAVARVREGAFLRHVIGRYVENLLDWADAEFARDTSESIARARELYELAQTLLGADELPPEDRCRAAWRGLLAQIAATHSPEQARLLLLLLGPLAGMGGRLKRSDLAKIGEALAEDQPFDGRLQAVKQLVDQVKGRPAPAKTLDGLLQEQAECQLRELVTEDGFNRIGISSGGIADLHIPGPFAVAPEATLASRTVQKIGCGFCVPPNPLLTTLRFRAETNLEKIRTCRNIAGMGRTVQVYAPSADPMAVVRATAAGEEIEETVPTEPPPVHRFSYLIERARYYADVARQLESQLLNAFEREDAEKYNLLKARQDARASQSNLSLQDLRVDEANDGVTLAQLQRDRAVEQKNHFVDLLATGLSDYEKEAISRLWTAHGWTIAATTVGSAAAIGGALVGAIFGTPGGPPGMSAGAILGGILGGLAGSGHAMEGIANVHSLASQAVTMQASFERRREEWQLDSELAEWDRQLGEQGITLSNDRVAIAGQEREIARLQDQFTREVVEFLGTKFLNVQLWQWMGKVIRRHYRDHLTFATVAARMAQRALEFERQQTIAIVAAVYAERERRDLLVAEHLLTDINKLDQHRLTTDRRLKELTKTISLAQLDPVGFNTLRQGHGMTFTTPLSLFDQDFPGHYLRLVKSVSLTVIALVPPTESIHATLSNTGLSRVMIGPPFDQPRVIQRQPESIAVTAASNGTGLFELRFDDPILLPFEGAGVETTWMLDLPKGANRFDFGTLADILLTVRYTAQEDKTYREKVLSQMGMTTDRKLRAGGSISFPLRTALPDEWFDLHHPQFVPNLNDYGLGPGKVKPPYLMQFELRPGDFPPNEIDHATKRLNLAFRQSRIVTVPIEIWFNPIGVTDEYSLEADYAWDPAVPSSGPISVAAFARHRADSQAAWRTVATHMTKLAPFGTWRLRLRNEDATQTLIDRREHAQNKLLLDWLEDLLFVVAYDASVEYRFAS
jgi:hypothetical protein